MWVRPERLNVYGLTTFKESGHAIDCSEGVSAKAQDQMCVSVSGKMMFVSDSAPWKADVPMDLRPSLRSTVVMFLQSLKVFLAMSTALGGSVTRVRLSQPQSLGSMCFKSTRCDKLRCVSPAWGQ